jgi:hypothetical protein
MDLRSFIPANAGPVRVLSMLWQEAQRDINMDLPSSIGGAAITDKTEENKATNIVIFAFMTLFSKHKFQKQISGKRLLRAVVMMIFISLSAEVF